MQGNSAYWAHCGDSRLYFVRGDKLLVRTGIIYLELQQSPSSVVPLNERYNRNVLFTCPGQPRQTRGGYRRPHPAAGRRPHHAAPMDWGHVEDDEITRHLSSSHHFRCRT